MVEAFEEALAGRGRRARPDRGRLVRHRHRGAARRQVRRAARDDAAAAVHPGDARRELLRDRHRGVPRRGLCGRLRRRATSRSRSASRSSRTPATAACRSAAAARLNNLYWPNLSAPGSFAQLAAAYRAKHGVDKGDLKRAMAHISVKSHDERRQEPQGAPAEPDHRSTTCSRRRWSPSRSASTTAAACRDGAACAIVTTPEIARVARQARPGRREGAAARRLQRRRRLQYNDWDGSYFATTRIAAARAPTQEAGIKDPRQEISLIEVHDCFSITELVTHGGPRLSPEGGALKRRARRLLRRRPARCPARSTAASSASAIRSAPRACAWSTRCTCSCTGRAGERQRDGPGPPADAQPRRLPEPERLVRHDRRAPRGVESWR